MQLLTGILIAVCWILLLPIMRLFTTFFHEMGHAIPALVLTDGKVEVFVGSYGNRQRSRNISIGRLSLHFSLDVFDWKIGMCIPYGQSTWLGSMIILLGGPIASIIVCSSVMMYLTRSSYPDYILVIALAMFLLAILDLFVNLIPAATSYRSPDGQVQLSDGRQIQQLLLKRKLPKEYFELETKLHNQQYDEVIEELKSKIEEKQPKEYYQLLISACLKNRDYKEVIGTYEKMIDYHPLIKDDYRTIGLSYLELKNYTECVRCLNEYLYANFSDFEANCARGVARMQQGDKIEALRDFEAAISYSKHENVSIPLSHRAYLQIMLNHLEEGYQDLLSSKKYDQEEKNEYLPYYFATYHEKVGEYDKALFYYKKAKDKDFDFYGLEYKIYEMEELIKTKK